MRIGFCTRYCHHEAAYAAVRLMQCTQQMGHDVTVRAITPRPVSLDSMVDRMVKSTQKQLFTEWAGGLDCVVWTHAPHYDQVNWAKRRGIRTVLFSLWTEVAPEDRRTYQIADSIITPCREGSRFLKTRWDLTQTWAMPWDPGLPFTLKSPDRDPSTCHVLLPLYDGNARRTEATAIEVAGRMLLRYEQTQLTVAYNSSSFAPFAKRRIDQFCKYFPGRVHLRPGVPVHERPVLFRQHDLTLWPTHVESCGMVGLTSVMMGTPVIAFAFSPVTEFLNEQNSVLAPTETVCNDMGVPSARPVYAELERVLHQTLESPEVLRNLQGTVLHGLPQRRTAFRDVLQRVFC